MGSDELSEAIILVVSVLVIVILRVDVSSGTRATSALFKYRA
jgi:hypothetical protein